MEEGKWKRENGKWNSCFSFFRAPRRNSVLEKMENVRCNREI
jgi:hypothetical protein